MEGKWKARSASIDGHMWGHPPKKHTSGADLNYLQSNKFLLLHPYYGVWLQVSLVTIVSKLDYNLCIWIYNLLLKGLESIC